jgi:ABC-2 type transport system permease protein
VALLLIRLKLTLQRHSTSVARVLSIALAVGGTALTWYLVAAPASGGVRSELLTLALAVWAAGWALGPTIANGAGVLRSRYFALLPLDRRRVGRLLLVAVFADVGPAVTLVAVAALVWHALAMAPAAAVVAVPGALLLWVFVITLSRLVFHALGAAMRSRLGMEIASVQWGLLLAGMFFGWMALQPALAATGALVRDGLGARTAGFLALLPTSWPVAAVEAFAAGDTAGAFARLGLFALMTAALVAVTAALLAPPVGARGGRRRSRPLGARPPSARRRSPLPDTPLGAVVGKELRQWWRDPWRGLEVRSSLWAGLFTGLLMWSNDGFAALTPFAGVVAAFVMVLSSVNLYGHDGTALWLTVVGQGRDTARADVRGRQIALVLLSVPASAAMSTAFVFATGAHWAWPLVIAATAVVVGVGVGLSPLLSVVAVSPGVEPRLRVDANDSGDNQVQVWTSMAALPVLSAPTVLAAVPAALAGTPWLAVPVALANGGLAAWWLGRLAHRRLEARLPETFTRIRYGRAVAARAVPERGTWLDRMERAAISGNSETRPTGS